MLATTPSPFMDEIELKFAVPREARAALESALRRGSVRVERLRAIYFDTPDERLGRHGLSLRLRKQGRHWFQTVKAATGDPLRRLEHEVPVEPPSATREPALDLSRHDGSEAGAALRRALGADVTAGGPAALAVRFRTDVSRIARTVRLQGARVELCLDTGRIGAGDRTTPVAEFELELKSGSAEALMALAARWAERHALWLSTVSKAERGARLVRGDVGGQPVKASAPQVGPKIDAHGFLVAALQSCLAQVLGNASEVAAGGADEEYVHELRVGLRRLRTALRELKADRAGADPGWEPVLRHVFEELGRHRDRTIVLPAVRAELAAAGLAPPTESALATGEGLPADVVRSGSFQRTLLGLLAFTHERAAQASAGIRGGKGKGVRALVAKRLDALHRLLAHDAVQFDRLSPARQHRVRKRLKRLRYLCEFAAPLFGSAQVTQFLARWRDAQQALGECNDHRMAIDAFRARAPKGSNGGPAVGWLKARRRAMVGRCQRALRKASRAEPFWRG